ncbi:23S rRNA (guanosine(2251)-2'-O)-methyltransferase RlmB [Parasediminibacterium sp. JCM 36343]|uniref:23S rRNA (guanosine(2251)-2'-O)-methyltransferase RlmB n=1 Tax=Parasediminibacterium sp. JCM 36343 TaxID=3374279 RepID=UPI0039796CB9
MSKKETLIIGRQPLVEALQSGRVIDKILLQKNASGEVLSHIRALSKEFDVPMQMVPVEKLNYMTKANHQGVIALAALVVYKELDEVLEEITEKGETPLFIMLDGITDVRNIGAIARSAYCCGAQAIIIPDKGVGLLNEEAMKSSAGALDHIHIIRVNSLIKAVDSLREKGVLVYTSEMKAEKKIYELPLTDGCCIIMGNEEKGVQPYLAKAADAFFSIPMATKFDSFNVSVAAGIVLYEALKQRMG